MGLKSGDHGVKTELKQRFPGAFRRFNCLTEGRDAVLGACPDESSSRERTALFVDGNVLLMSVPESVGDLDGFCTVVYRHVREALRTASLVIVVFDEPECLTGAKKEEQARRDAARSQRTVTSSADLNVCTLGNDFTCAELLALKDVHIIKSNRGLRLRFYDEVTKRVFERASAVMTRWGASGADPGTLLFDGVDVRGCTRANDEPRAPCMVGTEESVVAAFEHNQPTGEGDIKLIKHETRLRELVSNSPAWSDYRLVITSTIDTDAFSTSLLDVSKRRVNPFSGALHSVFAMREPPSKRARAEGERATFLCCDAALLEGLLQEHIWASAKTVPTPVQMLDAMLALLSAAALCGCDFTGSGLKGSRFDHFIESIPRFVVGEARALSCFGNLLSADPILARRASSGLTRLCIAASTYMMDKPRFKRQAEHVATAADDVILRALWSVAYWGQTEYAADANWGFCPTEQLHR